MAALKQELAAEAVDVDLDLLKQLPAAAAQGRLPRALHRVPRPRPLGPDRHRRRRRRHGPRPDSPWTWAPPAWCCG
ncbi:MAG: hypothetical protein MZV70_20795 [Desulfobacterales bacterium]|nr:hypothetical protein [Desulfobacterales bacterium]